MQVLSFSEKSLQNLDSELDLSFQTPKLMISWLLVFPITLNQTQIFLTTSSQMLNSSTLAIMC